MSKQKKAKGQQSAASSAPVTAGDPRAGKGRVVQAVNEERFRQLFENIQSGVAVYEAVDNGEDFILRDFNRAAEEIEHVARTDVVGQRVSKAFPGVKESGILGLFQRVWSTGEPEYLPEALYRDERNVGSWRENWAYKLSFGEIVAVYNDITPRKRTELRLRKEVEWKNLLFWLYEKGGQLTDRELYGHILEQVVKLTDSTIGFLHRVSENQKEAILTMWNKEAISECTACYDAHYPIERAGNWVDCVRLKQPVIYNDFPNSPNRRGLPEGHAPVRRFMSIPVMDRERVEIIFGVGNKIEEYDDYDVAHVRLVAHDLYRVIRQHESEEVLRKSEAKYHDIFENATEGIYQSLPGGRLIDVNPAGASIFGYETPEQMVTLVTDVGKELYVNFQDRVTYKDLLRETGSVRGFEAQFRRKDGSVIWCAMNGRHVRDASGKLLYFEGTVVDITSRRMAQEDLKRTTEKLRKALAGTINAMSLTVETRDPYTAGHQKRVSSLARLIAQEMGLAADTIDSIRMAGVVHDIGKMSVPAEILSKPSRLSEIELSLIRAHTRTGYEILKESELPHPIAEIVLQHHERLDGSGYPRGLKNGEILIEARIIAVADVIEAISSHRPYRPSRGIDAALGEIEQNKDILYDPVAVEACLKIFREKSFRFE